MKKVLIEDYKPDIGEVIERVGEYIYELYGNEKSLRRLKSEMDDLHFICFKDIVMSTEADLMVEAMESEVQELETAEDLRNARRGGLVRFG